jgi:hypothetical protein
MSVESVKGQFSNFKIFEAVVVDVDTSNGNIHIVSSSLKEFEVSDVIPPVYYGGVSGSGMFQHPEVGDIVICARVYPGGKGITQALRVIPKASREADTIASVRSVRQKAGQTEYPIYGLKPGEVKLAGLGGSELYLMGEGERGSGIFLGNRNGDGLTIKKNSLTNTAVGITGDSIKLTTEAGRLVSRNIYRFLENDASSIAKISKNNKLVFDELDSGKRRGLFPGREASTTAILGGIRNPALSEYRLVVNEFSETDYFKGWDLEAEKRNLKEIDKFSDKFSLDSLSSENSLHLAPHQIVEVIIGNVANKRGEILDINYNPIILGDERGLPVGSDLSLVYEEARLKSKRGIGYHFQLSTNTLSTEVSNSLDNFIFSIDKEGALKANIPSTSDTGNIFYPSKAIFRNESSGRIDTDYLFERKTEKIPITLRDLESGIIYPSGEEVDASQSQDGVPIRYTGIRFSNDNNYFKGLEGTSEDPDSVRVNPTRHHNMYATAEMLIANTVKKISIPFQNAKCSGYIPGNSTAKAFERRASQKNGSFDVPNYMSSVVVDPGPPAMSTGGGVIVAGTDYTLEEDAAGNRINLQYTNDFSLSKSGSQISAENKDSTGEARLSPGGKSANISMEGSLELSVGADNSDRKSMLLDTAGSIVAWFGRDKNGRSMVMQTDGDVLLNVGGVNGDEFNKGRLDLRVNVNHKGFFGEEEADTHASDYVISISEDGLVIAGMNPGAPMVIRNDGDLNIESTSKLILSGQSVEIREGNRPSRKTHRSPESIDTPDATLDGVSKQIDCILSPQE